MRENVYDKRWGQSGKDWWKASPYITTGGSALDGGVSLGRITEDQAYTWLHNYSVSQKNPPPEGPDIFCFVTNGSEFLIDFYTPIIYTFLCTLDHKFLFNYLHNLYTHLRGTNNTVKSSSFRLLEMNQRYSSPLRSILLPAGLTGFVAI